MPRKRKPPLPAWRYSGHLPYPSVHRDIEQETIAARVLGVFDGAYEFRHHTRDRFGRDRLGKKLFKEYHNGYRIGMGLTRLGYPDSIRHHASRGRSDD